MMTKVAEVMTKPVITLKKDNSVMDAVKIMADNSISCIVIVDDSGKPLGIVTERDMVKRVLKNSLDPNTTKIDAIMTSPVMTISSEKRVIQAIETMHKYRFRRLVITSDDGKIAGIITQSNLLMKVHKTQKELERMNESLRKSVSSLKKYSKIGSKDARVKSLKEKIKRLERELEKRKNAKK